MSLAQLIHRLQMMVVIFIALCLLQGAPPVALGAGTIFIVTKAEDTNDGTCDSDCSLREAIRAANANPSANTIILDGITYNLTISGADEDAAATGDLDIYSNLTIIGTGTTVIDAGEIDRIFHVHSGNVSIRGVTLRNGKAHAGGAIFSHPQSALTVEDSSFLNNQANSGGAIFTEGVLVIQRTTFHANNASIHDGGAIFVGSSGRTTVTNSTLSDNRAQGNGGGLVMSATGSPSATVLNSTIVNNSAAVGGGVSNNWSGSLVLRNTIVAYNTAQNCSGTITNRGNNLQSPGTTCAEFTTADPLLQPALQNNGGPTLTRAPQAGSPAIDAISSGRCPATDQRGYARPVDGNGDGVAVCDIGAVEVGAVVETAQAGPTFTVNTADDSNDGICGVGHCSLREAIVAANADAAANWIHFNIPGSGPHSIEPTYSLPDIIHPVTIDGATQPGASCAAWPPLLQIEIDGTILSGNTPGLVISGGNSTIRGLAINRFPGAAIRLETGDGNQVECNYVGTDPGGTLDRGNAGAGIEIIAGSVNNRISKNSIHSNGGLGIDLGADGVTANDVGDVDAGPNNLQNFPLVLRAAPDGSNNLRIQGRMHGAANRSYTVEFFANRSCDVSGHGQGEIYLATTTLATDNLGNGDFSLPLTQDLPWNYFITATATDPDGNTSEFSPCTAIGPANNVWTRAQNLDVRPGFGGDPMAPSVLVVDQFLNQPAQSRWYKFTVQPGSRISINLSNLPANYDLALFRDIGAAWQEMNAPQDQDLLRLGAEFAPEYFTPEYFTPEYFTPEYFTPEYFTPEYFTPEYFTPEYFTPEYFTPEYFTPEYFTPEYFTPEYFTPEAYSSVQRRSLVAVSAGDGLGNEVLEVNTWSNTGSWYIRVYGRDGAHSLNTPFHLQVTQLYGACGQVTATVPPQNQTNLITASAGAYESLILTDQRRMAGTEAEKQALLNKLQILADRPEVRGLVLDVGADGRVAYLNGQADRNHRCPYAKNLVAEAIRNIIRDVREQNRGLTYIVLAGNDDVIPFFRHPDNALLANESGYMPPVLEQSASNASLRMGYVLSQDAYGAQLEVAFKSTVLPIPDLAVGRLVETPAEIMTMLDAYLSTNNGVAPTPQTGLVTGYEFMVDAAEAFGHELAAGMGRAPNTLLTSETKPTWSADELRAALLGSRHDLVFLAGHFSTAGALAADYQTRMAAAEVARSPVNLTNSIIVGMGCHAGYNTVDDHAIPMVTQQPDWAQAFARKGATLISGTGYQYGDTDFLAHSELLYVELSKQLRYGSGPVPLGKALVEAKKAFLAHHPDLRGISEKSYLIATLFGLPMLSVDMPQGRIPAPARSPLVGTSNLTAATTNPGLRLGLHSADVTVATAATLQTKDVHDTYFNQQVTTTYLQGADGVVSNPAEPVLPVQWANASIAGTVLRGVLFLGGAYTDLPDVRPMTGSPTTEGSAIQAPFFTDYFYPVLPWRVNYLDALAGGVTRLIMTPAQFRSNANQPERGTLRRFNDMRFRLYYSNDITTYGANTPALAAPPVLSDISSEWVNGSLTVRARVQGDPAAGIQAVFATYTAVTGPLAGHWHSLPLQQKPQDSTLWEGTVALNGTPPTAIRYFLQAVNGVGLVGVDTNRGVHYTPGEEAVVSPIPPETAAATQIALLPTNPTTAAYNTTQIFRAQLEGNGGAAIAGQTLRFRLGTLQLQATTDANGIAAATTRILLTPGHYDLQVSFAGSEAYRSAAATGSLQVTQRETWLALSPAVGTGQYSGPTTLSARLSEAEGRRLGERTLFFVLEHSDGRRFSLPVITDLDGEAQLWAYVPEGLYTVTVYFNGQIPFSSGVVRLTDPFYQPSYAVGSLTVSARNALVDYTGATIAALGQTLNLSAQVTQDADGSVGDLAMAQVRFEIFRNGGPALDSTGTPIAKTVPVAPDGAAVATIQGLSSGIYEIRSTVIGGYFASPVNRTLLVIYDPTGGFATGGGWIESPTGACQLGALCGKATGKASFVFVARHQMDAQQPSGNTRFHLQGGALDFQSTSYEWLITAGSQAKFKGIGTINGSGNFGFMITAVDGDDKKHIPDGFRIKIWDRNNNQVVYDNQMGAGDDSYAVTSLSGGSIVIHEQPKGKTTEEETESTLHLYLPVITNR
jgi:CSLREA domain-containing protein